MKGFSFSKSLDVLWEPLCMSALQSTLQRFKLAALQGHQADTIVEIQNALKEGRASDLRKALDELKGTYACRYLLEAMLRTATKPMEVAKLLGRLKK